MLIFKVLGENIDYSAWVGKHDKELLPTPAHSLKISIPLHKNLLGDKIWLYKLLYVPLLNNLLNDIKLYALLCCPLLNYLLESVLWHGELEEDADEPGDDEGPWSTQDGEVTVLLHPVGHLLEHLQYDGDPQEEDHAGIILAPAVFEVRPFTLG